jgi:hypothetical protein
MHYFLMVTLIAFPLAVHAGNIQDTDLIASNVFFLPPSTAKTVFIQARNSSDNQGVSLHDLRARLTAKGYEIVQDPSAAHYVVLANIVYCNVTKPEMPVEAMVASGYGSGFGSSMMSGLSSLTGMASMAGPQGAMAGRKCRTTSIMRASPICRSRSKPLLSLSLCFPLQRTKRHNPRCIRCDSPPMCIRKK